MKLRVSGVLAAVAVVAVAGCGGGGPSDTSAREARTLTVLAAASLTESFNAMETQFESEHPGVDVRINYGGSSDLAQQIVNGAPADVFAAASDSTITPVADAGLVNVSPTVFATNVLQIATAPGNPEGIDSFDDLARPDLTVVVCAPQVPCGSAAQRIEQATGVMLNPVSEEQDVKTVLGRVETGNADAGLVYVTDVRAAGDGVEGVSFPEANQAVNDYPIAALAEAPQPELAREFVALVTGDFGARTLQAAGFGTP